MTDRWCLSFSWSLLIRSFRNHRGLMRWAPWCTRRVRGSGTQYTGVQEPSASYRNRWTSSRQSSPGHELRSLACRPSKPTSWTRSALRWTGVLPLHPRPSSPQTAATCLNLPTELTRASWIIFTRAHRGNHFGRDRDGDHRPTVPIGFPWSTEV